MTRTWSMIVVALFALPSVAAVQEQTHFAPLTLGAVVDICTTLNEDFFGIPQHPPAPPADLSQLGILERMRTNGECLRFLDGFITAEAMRESPGICNPVPENRYAKHMIAAAIARWGTRFPERRGRPAGREILLAWAAYMPCSTPPEEPGVERSPQEEVGTDGDERN